ncbi:MAG: cupin domain-containing protein [Bacteroidales bacterium]|nr:cupin domain-containing protein [Bacteroidales bacterium]
MKTQVKKEELLVLTDVIKILVDKTETNGKYAIFEENVPPLGGPPPHLHPDEEIFYVVEGEFEFILNDIQHPFRAMAGSVVHIPSNALHTFKNVGNTQGKMVVFLSPGNLLDYFRVIGRQLNGSADYPDLSIAPDFTELDVKKAFEFAPQYRVQFVLPEIMEK